MSTLHNIHYRKERRRDKYGNVECNILVMSDEWRGIDKWEMMIIIMMMMGSYDIMMREEDRRMIRSSLWIFQQQSLVCPWKQRLFIANRNNTNILTNIDIEINDEIFINSFHILWGKEIAKSFIIMSASYCILNNWMISNMIIHWLWCVRVTGSKQ
jgi:hypothetical protein